MRVSRSRSVAVLASVSLAGVASLIPATAPSAGDIDVPTDGGDPNGYVIAQHDHTTVYEPPPGVIGGNATVEAFDAVDDDGLPVRRVQMTWQSNEDVAAADSEASMVLSDDGGYTFPSGVNTETGAGWFSKLRDGSIIGVEFIPGRVIDERSVELIARRSTDNGSTWKDLPATFTTDLSFDGSKFDRGIRVHRDIFHASDGALLMTYYTTYAGDPGYRTELARSTDGGATWHRYATVAQFTDDRWMGESGIERAANGDLVAVHRTGTPGGANIGPLYVNRSSDDGRTWTRPEPLRITTASGEPAPTTGVMPVLRLLPNGIMTLTFGRPDNWIAISPDGLGHSFEQAQRTYVNHPRVNQAFQRNHGSSGNGAHAVVAANRVLVVGDNCAPSWGCPETDAGFTVDGEYRVWKKFVDVVGPNVGKIDLLGKVEAGTVTVDTTMTHTMPRLPEMSPLGAIDGSTDWASAAVLRSPRGEGVYTVELDREYTLNQIGLALQYGVPGAARVEVSSDGSTWTEVVDTGTITSYTQTYYPVRDVRARHVRVTVADTDPRAPEFLGELELYSTVDSFENDPVGQVPRGYTGAIGASVTDFDVDDSRHVMRLADAWTDKIASARWVSEAAVEQTLAFRVNSIGYARGFAFTTLGSTDGASNVPAYHLNIGADGSIGWYSYETRTWTKIAPAGAAPQRLWHEVRVEATLAGADVFLGGEQVGSVRPSTSGLTALTGHQFASSGTSSQYDHFLIDDVEQS